MSTQRERARWRNSAARYRQRMRDKGYRLVRGRWTKEPRQKRGEADGPPPHGTRARYYSRRWPCRCRVCTDGVAEANREYRRRRRQGVLL